MPFISVPGLKGKVYVPEPPADGEKKHNCTDCFACQMCSDDRCRTCRSNKEECRNACDVRGRRE